MFDNCFQFSYWIDLDRKAGNMTKYESKIITLAQTFPVYFPHMPFTLIKHQEANSSLNHNSYIFYRQRVLGNIIYAYGNCNEVKIWKTS